jgi:hypothetical protein
LISRKIVLREKTAQKRKATNLSSGEKEKEFRVFVHFFEGERAKRFANFVTRNHETRGKSLDS